MAEAKCDVPTYYESIPQLFEGQPATRDDWIALAVSLRDLLQSTHTVIPYTSSSGTDVWDALQVVDSDPNDPTRVMLLYSNRSVPFSPHGNSEDWNREHVLPKSYGLFESGPDYSDIHNLRPEDTTVNSIRGNLYFDDCYPSQNSKCVQPASPEADPTTAKSNLVFMPPEYRKGIIARSNFYMALRYNGTYDEASTERMAMSDCPCVSSHAFGNLTTELRWHQDHPVYEDEIDRNDKVCAQFQHNRNPFVDFPWLYKLFTLDPVYEDLVKVCPPNYSGNPDSC